MTEWITLLTVIVGFLYQAYRETRQRRWDREDREMTKRDLLESTKRAERLAVNASADAAAQISIVEGRLVDEATKLADAIGANAAITRKIASAAVRAPGEERRRKNLQIEEWIHEDR